MNLFTWLRKRIAESFLAGIHDALEQLGTSEDGEAVAQLRVRLQPALPAPEGRRKKGE